MTCERSTKDGPFCWQNKHVLRSIRDHFDATNNVSSALAVYVALTEIASNKQSEVFDRRIGDIAARAGVSYKTADKVLHRLEALAIVAIMRHKVSGTNENAPSTYRLLRFSNNCPTLGNGTEPEPFPRKIEESPEDPFEDPHHSGEWRSAYGEDELQIIDLYNGICVPRGWLPVNRYSAKLVEALEKLAEGCDLDDFEQMFYAAAEERERGDEHYTTPRGNKLIRILWNNY
jgi:hypothetical protein